MKTLSTPVTNEAAASQSGWTELYDFYLPSSITTPWGSTSILRLTPMAVDSNGFSFFKPKISPEATADQGDPQSYYTWPLKREVVKSDSKFSNDKMQIVASNVSTDFAQMIAAVSWYDVPVIIRKVPTSNASPTADDCVVLWSGQIDSVIINEKQITFEASSDLATLAMVAPRENMHALCRFQWADDQCTMIRFLQANYKAMTVGNSSTDTVVKSSDLTQDTGSSGTYGTDRINPLADGSITASSEQTALAAVACSVSNTVVSGFDNNLVNGSRVKFAGTLTGITAGTYYYVVHRHPKYFQIASTPGGSPISFSVVGPLTVTSEFGYEAFNVKSSKPTLWAFSNSADWGNQTNGFYQIPDAQAGLQNSLLKPWIHFDFGSARQLKLWRIQTATDAQMEELARLIQIFSSTDDSTWKFETYYELPPVGGTLYDIPIPTAQSARYWKICVRSRWANALYYKLLEKAYAYTDSRNWWARGRITFASNTTTAALRGISRRVEQSYSGEVHVAKLPATPVNGDTFTIERGCSRTFNACCERQNWENFGGFTDLPYQAVIR